MPCRRPLALLVVCVVAGGISRGAFAQDRGPRLNIPTFPASAAAAADLASTYQGLKHVDVQETSPLLRRWQGSRGKLVSMAALMDMGSITAWNLTVGRADPRGAVSGLWG